MSDRRGGGGEQLGFDDLLGAGPTHPALVPVPSARRVGARRTVGAGRGTAVQEPLLPVEPFPAGPVDAAEIARLLGRPVPTPEQVEVIEAPLEPLLVVAGAGSGKTETMAARVVWLVANGHVRPEEVLGLTFTRKAAGELAERVRSRLRALRRRMRVPGEHAGDEAVVTVSTYHSYAAAVLADHGLRLGVEPGAQLLGEAAAWQLAAEVVQAWDADLSVADRTPNTVTEALLGLAGECAEHLVGAGEVAAFTDTLLERIEQLPALVGDPGPGEVKGSMRERVATIRRLRALVPLVERYAERKRELGVLDFGDQVALAARLAGSSPEVGAGERTRFRVVLLDEYQDTSHAQLVLLRSLFGGGHCVTAVGDPHQSIYGWRGASAGNLQAFPHDFPVVLADGATVPAHSRYLSTSWRNDAAVLVAANRVAEPLRRPPSWVDETHAVGVPALRGRPGAGPGEVLVGWHATLEEEVEWISDVVAGYWRAGRATGGMPAVDAPTAAVLCRVRSQFPLVEAALRKRHLPVEVVGLGGLLHVPEVAELRAALEVLHDPTRGDSLVRLLAGPAVRLGPRDLEALNLWSQEQLRRWGRSPGQNLRETAHQPSLVEALDELPPPGWAGQGGRQLSDAGRGRLERLAGLLRDLRARAGLALPDLVAEVERALLLDVEVTARPGVRPATARAHLDAFVDVAAAFSEAGRGGTLAGFLAWLAAADERERGLDAPLAAVRPDAVQVLTVHAAKGLEWDLVAVPGLVEGTFPTGNGRAPGAGSNGWLSGAFGALPYPLRGDAARLPHWAAEAARSQADLAGSFDAFRVLAREHEVAEERRLAYVAATRARAVLALSGSVWGDGTTPREPSRFLVETAELAGSGEAGRDPGGVRVAGWADAPEDGATNPRDLNPPTPWPIDPLGDTRQAMEEAAAMVRAYLAGTAPDDAGGAGSDSDLVSDLGSDLDIDDVDDDPVVAAWDEEAALLLAEREAAAHGAVRVELPAHLSASKVVVLAADPDAFADRLRRPLPQPPQPQARRGSAFHAWLERRFGAAALVDLEELPGAADDAEADEDLAVLQERFLASEWAALIPEDVEVAVETPVAGLVVRGRIDAVFRYETPDGPRWDVVDWKTGPPARGEAEQRARAVQLAVYRLAWARLQGVPVEHVGAAFFHAATGTTVRPVEVLDGPALEALIGARVGA
ncbi:MAG TPA: ATP-dependent DNA helicase [Kineosporiaceae bacterium]|nr:ATP-dependent DNA helicase [Kineosporiaceae bacterium]